MAELGTTTLLACSNATPGAVDDLDLTAEQLHRVGEVAAEAGVTVAFEALAWGRHVNRVGQAWEAVVRADHPAITLAVDTFHLLARGDDGTALAGVPGDRIGFLQVADAPLAGHEPARVEPALPVLPRARARSTSPASSRPPSRRATAARCRSRCSATSSARPTPGDRPRRDALAGVPRGRAVVRRTPRTELVTRRRPRRRPHRRGVPRDRRPPATQRPRPTCSRAGLRARRSAPHQAGGVVAQRRRPRRAQRRRRRRRTARHRARPRRPTGRGGRRTRPVAAVARGRHHPRRRRGHAPRHHLPVRAARLRQRRRRRSATTGSATSSCPAPAGGGRLARPRPRRRLRRCRPAQRGGRVLPDPSSISSPSRRRGVHGAARPAAQPRAAAARRATCASC